MAALTPQQSMSDWFTQLSSIQTIGNQNARDINA